MIKYNQDLSKEILSTSQVLDVKYHANSCFLLVYFILDFHDIFLKMRDLKDAQFLLIIRPIQLINKIMNSLTSRFSVNNHRHIDQRQQVLLPKRNIFKQESVPDSINIRSKKQIQILSKVDRISKFQQRIHSLLSFPSRITHQKIESNDIPILLKITPNHRLNRSVLIRQQNQNIITLIEKPKYKTDDKRKTRKSPLTDRLLDKLKEQCRATSMRLTQKPLSIKNKGWLCESQFQGFSAKNIHLKRRYPKLRELERKESFLQPWKSEENQMEYSPTKNL